MSISALDAINRRRTVRNYESDPIPKEILEKIMESAKLSPTACNFQGHDYVVVTNKEKLDAIEKVVIETLPEGKLKSHFIGRRERHGVHNIVTCDAPCVVLIVKNERADKDWIKVDAGIAAMSIMIAAQNFGIESMCLGVVGLESSHKQIEDILGLKDQPIVVGVALGKPKPNLEIREKEIKTKVTYIE